jgi:hypothetical protein
MEVAVMSSPILFSLEISYGDLLRKICNFHVYLQMMMIYRQKLQTQLVKSRRISYIAPEN